MAAINGREERLLDIRRRTLLLILVITIVVLGMRLFQLQVIKHNYYKRLAISNRIQRERIIAPRGLIRASGGEKLVVNLPVYQIDILPGEIRGREERLTLACDWLGIDRDRLFENLADWRGRYPDGREMTVVQAANKKQISILRENRRIFPFFRLVMKHRRQYPEGSLAVHVLGYVGEVTDEDLERNVNLHPGDIVGRMGVELRYEKYLRGTDGVRIVEISAEGTRVGEIDGVVVYPELEGFTGSRPPVPGNDVYLTIDLDLQRAVESLFEWEKGVVVAMDPRDGRILAATSRPTYDPHIFIGGASDEDWGALFNNPSKPLFNRIVQAGYPPGSTFKLVTTYASLRHGLVRRDSYLRACSGGYRFGNRNFKCWKPEGHGALTLYGAVVNSCDVYFYQLGEMLTADQFASSGELFGLGRRTGVDLPGETAGILPDVSYYNKRYGRGQWTKGHMLNYAIGQGEILCNPMQIAVMTAMVANGGVRVRPHVVDRILDPEGTAVFESRRINVPVPQFDGEVLAFIRRAMEGVVHDESGTGRASSIPGVRIAGKTGTAQNPHGEDHALFVAFAPAGNPEIVLTIIMENAGHGGAVAAPLARRILSHYFLSVAGR